jgi:hypothetical protein
MVRFMPHLLYPWSKIPQYLLDARQIKSKCKDILAHAMKAYTWSRGIAPLILNLTARWRWVVNFMPGLVYHGKEPWQPLNRRLCRPRDAELFHSHSIPWTVIRSVLIQNIMQLYTTPTSFILQIWIWPSEVEGCCQFQDTTQGILTAIYFSSFVASSEKFWESVSKLSRITWYKHCGVVFNTLSFTFEIFRVLMSAEIQRSFM